MDADPLSGLQDIALPTPPSWLPPQGPGWWLLGLLLLAALVWGAWRFRQWRRRNRYRREALAQLEHLAPGLETTEALAEFSALLKRTALAVFPREAVAPLSGNSWRDFLRASGGPAFADAACDPLFSSAYRVACETTPQQRAALIAAARQWIVGHRAPDEAGGRRP
ncbi:hypothetical protein B9N43_02875 [Denitratisoma sp. DHT3]|uniref:DUF4381 domain-containing protein n=1 Tax=Denitratisoma sp. DHT3 TaxID=1981880 RepID=UPI001198373E|nr:DUF4381 domain-containing protein [Denitratisoma sp. DHT3]QDX80299.1 hypothetical protein B9N43_02875 [Denitratisoma sp. DHT3]